VGSFCFTLSTSPHVMITWLKPDPVSPQEPAATQTLASIFHRKKEDKVQVLLHDNLY
jgi:hypothetical protein